MAGIRHNNNWVLHQKHFNPLLNGCHCEFCSLTSMADTDPTYTKPLIKQKTMHLYTSFWFIVELSRPVVSSCLTGGRQWLSLRLLQFDVNGWYPTRYYFHLVMRSIRIRGNNTIWARNFDTTAVPPGLQLLKLLLALQAAPKPSGKLRRLTPSFGCILAVRLKK